MRSHGERMEKMAEKIDSMVNERRLLRLGYVTRLALNSIEPIVFFPYGAKSIKVR